MELIRVQDSDYKKSYELFMTFEADENGFLNPVYGYDYDKFLEWIGIPNLGLCIILLTVVVKCVLLPLTIKQQRFTKLSSYAQPELRAIQAKYQGRRDNYSMQAMQEETRAVYAKYGISQTVGCVQSFIQFPILIALYGAIRNLPLYIQPIRANFENIINTTIFRSG